jgi:hypothetical protein
MFCLTSNFVAFAFASVIKKLEPAHILSKLALVTLLSIKTHSTFCKCEEGILQRGVEGGINPVGSGGHMSLCCVFQVQLSPSFMGCKDSI